MELDKGELRSKRLRGNDNEVEAKRMNVKSEENIVETRLY